jgi:hypothetical protein
MLSLKNKWRLLHFLILPHSTRRFQHRNTLSFVVSFAHHYRVGIDNDRVPIVLVLENRSLFRLACSLWRASLIPDDWPTSVLWFAIWFKMSCDQIEPSIQAVPSQEHCKWLKILSSRFSWTHRGSRSPLGLTSERPLVVMLLFHHAP